MKLLVQFLLVTNLVSCELLTPEERIEVLKEHNDFRRQEGASNMALLSWNSIMEKETSELANWHFANNCTPDDVLAGHHISYDAQDGQGISEKGRSFAFGYNTLLALDHMDISIEGGKQYWNYDRNMPSNSISSTFERKQLIEYVNVVFAYTYEIGCGKSKCPDPRYSMLVCDYSQDGFKVYKDYTRIYHKGDPCSDCTREHKIKDRTRCDNGLCAKADDDDSEENEKDASETEENGINVIVIVAIVLSLLVILAVLLFLLRKKIKSLCCGKKKQSEDKEKSNSDEDINNTQDNIPKANGSDEKGEEIVTHTSETNDKPDVKQEESKHTSSKSKSNASASDPSQKSDPKSKGKNDEPGPRSEKMSKSKSDGSVPIPSETSVPMSKGKNEKTVSRSMKKSNSKSDNAASKPSQKSDPIPTETSVPMSKGKNEKTVSHSMKKSNSKSDNAASKPSQKSDPKPKTKNDEANARSKKTSKSKSSGLTSKPDKKPDPKSKAKKQ